MAKHIEKRFRKWYAVLDIPAGVRSNFGGKRRFFKAVNTESETVAIGRAALLVGQWKRQIAKARGTALDPFEADVDWFRRAIGEASAISAAHPPEGPEDDDPGGDAMSSLVDLAQDMDEKRPGRGLKVWKRATGETTGTLDHLEAWLAEAGDTDRGKAAKRSDIKRLARQFPNLTDVTRKAVRRWCITMLQDEGLQRSTVIRLLSGCRVYWVHLRVNEIVPDDSEPFDRLGLPAKTKNGSNRIKRKAFAALDVVRLHQAAQDAGHRPLADLISLGMYTGARIGELCALKVENVNLADGHFDIVSSKTEAGVRTVPIHPALQDTMARLVADSRDGFLLTGLTADQWGDRRGGLAKRFGRLKTSLGFRQGHDFHSIRKTVITMLTRADVRTTTIQDIVGHERKGMTEGVYYEGATLEAKAKALALLSYPTT